MEDKNREVSFLVFVGFLFLFILFLFLSPNEKSSGNAIIGSATLGENPSTITLLILFVILIVILAAVFVIFKKLKKKKIKIDSPARPIEIKQVVNEKKEEKIDFGDEDIEKLFSEPSQKKEEVKEEVLEKIPAENKVLTNLQDLKNKIKMMSSQNITREQIVNNLKSQGVTMDQINKAIEEVNIDNLREYVNQALKQGMTKDQIIRSLMMHGWRQEQISKVF